MSFAFKTSVAATSVETHGLRERPMASNIHQALLLWGARKMSRDGFQLTGFEGSADQGGRWNQLPPPFKLFGIRADACGVRPGDGVIGFAEAKSEEDIDTLHTRE